MENDSLVTLFEPERERLLSDIQQDRTPQAVQEVLEKAIDRLTIRYAEACADARTRDAAQLTLRTIKQALPLVDSVGEVRRWQSELPVARRSFTPATLAPMISGVVLILSGMLSLMISGGLAGIVSLVGALIPAALGMAALFWAGMKYNAPKPQSAQDGPTREELLEDGEKIWHHLKGMLLAADNALEAIQTQAEPEEHRAEIVAEVDSMPRAEVEMFSGLLESAYAMEGPDAREMVERICFYLHGAKVDVLDDAPGREAWFEYLPACHPGTIRPALASEEKLICKGLAAR